MAEAGVAFAAVGVEDPQRRSPPWWAGAIARDDHLRSLADDVTTEPDPRASLKLEADSGRLADRGIEAPRPPARRIQDNEADPGPPCECREPPESIAESRPRDAARLTAARLDGQVDDEQVHGPAREQRARDREALLGVRGRQHDQPLRLDAAGHRLDGIERSREVQPRDDRARRLGRGHEPQCQRRSPARDVAAHREAHAARDATRPEDRIELGEAGRMDTIGIDRPLARGAAGRTARPIGRIGILEWDGRERSDDLAREAARSPVARESGGRRAPARSKGRQGRGQVGRGSSHGLSIEQMFE